MAAQGVPMRALQEMMGHRDFKTTLIYADYAPSAREAEWVEAAFELDPEKLAELASRKHRSPTDRRATAIRGGFHEQVTSAYHVLKALRPIHPRSRSRGGTESLLRCGSRVYSAA